MKRTLLSILGLIVGTAMFAQVTKLSIHDLQWRSQSDLSNCQDSSRYAGDSVTISGVVITPGGQAIAGAYQNIYIQAGTDSFMGLDVFYTGTGQTSPTDMSTLLAGDSIVITGTVSEYKGETEIFPVSLKLVGTTALNKGLPRYKDIKLGSLNDSLQNNILTTGEQYEGNYVAIHNVRVISSSASGGKVTFTVRDSANNQIEVYARFRVQYLKSSATTGAYFNDFPPVGTVYKTLRGIVAHSKNNCPGNTGYGYELYPFDSNDYIVGVSPPIISSVTRTPAVPTHTQSPKVTADIYSAATIKSAYLFYSTGVGSTTWDSIAMTNVAGSTYSVSIPAEANRTFVAYYIKATDNSPGALTAYYPGNYSTAPYFYWVKDSGLTIHDVVYTPYSNGLSGYYLDTVTVSGIVTASMEANNIGFVFIQQPGQATYAGIRVGAPQHDNTSLKSLKIGDNVTVTGAVNDYNAGASHVPFLENIISIKTNANGAKITPVKLSPTKLSTYSFSGNREYAEMLITLAPDKDSGRLQVVQLNADSMTPTSANYGEYRVNNGNDSNHITWGCRVLAGRVAKVTSSVPDPDFSSLNVSFVNSPVWATKDSLMLVKVHQVQLGTKMDSLTGIMWLSYGDMTLLPRNNADFHNINIDTSVKTTINAHKNPAGKIGVYPNPNSGDFTITLPKEYNNSHLTLTIYDVAGKVVSTQNITNIPAQQIHTGLEAGCYFVEVSAENLGTVSQQKIIITK